MRTGRFSKAKSLLVVQAAVPAGAVDDAERLALLRRLLDDAVDEAERFVQKRRLAPNLDAVGGILAGLIRTNRRALGAPTVMIAQPY